MTSQRHKRAIAITKFDGHRLTRREREKLKLPAHPVFRQRREPAFPANPGAYVWYVLAVAPQQESRVVERMDDAGLVGFNPVEIVEVRQCRRVQYRRVERKRPLLTSYVLLGVPGRAETRVVPAYRKPVRVGGAVEFREMPAEIRPLLVTEPDWPAIEAIEGVIEPVRFEGVAVPLTLGEVLMLRAVHERAARARGWAPVVGETALITNGIWLGRVGQVERLNAGTADVRIAGEGVLAALCEPAVVPETWLAPPEAVYVRK